MKYTITAFLAVLIFCMFALGPQIAAQNATFSFTPVDLTVYGKPGDRIGCHAEVKNLTNQKLLLNLSRTRNDIPATWMSSFCLNQCYAPFTDNVQESVAAGVSLPFTIYFDTDGSVDGTGIVEMVITSAADPTESYKLVFKGISSSAVSVVENSRPTQMSLKQNYPNPFGPASASKSLSTSIDYALNKATDVTLTVFDMLGRRIKTLVSTHQAQGGYHVTWDGTNNNGQAEPAGIYLYKIETESFSKTNRMILLR